MTTQTISPQAWELEWTFAAVSDDETLDIVDALQGYHPAVSGCPVGRTIIVVSFPAENLRQAMSTALLLLERAMAGVERGGVFAGELEP